MNLSRPTSLLALVLLLPACDQIATLDGSKARDADAYAVGSACRQSGRALEDCFAMYPDSPKAQVFAGWKEMNNYMTENKMEVVAPTLVKSEVPKESRAGGKAEGGEAKPKGLPPTSAAAADPLAGLTKPLPGAPAGAAGLEKVGAKPADAAPAKH